MIEVRHVSLSYGKTPALKDVSLCVRPGEFVAIMGPGASGKSTLARVMDGLYLPDAGDCLVDGVSTRADPMRARRLVGLVLQEPDDQAVARRVADDLAFGPRNIGAADIPERVAEALLQTGIAHLADRDIGSLSGGQKQLVAIAGVLAMRPAYLVMDEPTSLLDSDGKRAVMDAVATQKHAGRGVAVITQDPSVAARADRVVVMSRGSVVAQGPPAEAFAKVPPGLIGLPEMTRLSNGLRDRGIAVKRLWLTVDDAAEELCR
ncbi:MAG: putative ABC transporter ATP-binding protein [Methanocella sp. PtaU1.Bin125]|nr:MAG: putative ABC transporter ATP-binding protein [Methanocella sp. PtaU1.Bin125]